MENVAEVRKVTQKISIIRQSLKIHSMVQAEILLHVMANKGVSPSAVAKNLSVSLATVSKNVSLLIEKGYVKKEWASNTERELSATRLAERKFNGK